jgi:glycosyltransferase involved in cell wall biosynthesis
MREIKVCYVISSLANQGPPNVLYNIIKYMDFSRFDISIVTMVPEPEISRLEEFKEFPMNIVQMSPDKIQNPLSMYLTLRKTVKKINPDILHTHCPRSMFLVPLLPKKYKKMETVHIYPGEQQRVMYGKIKGQIVIWLSNFFTKKMDEPIACSESVAQSYWDEQHYKMKAIPNGCSLPLWNGDSEEKAQLRKRFGLKDDVKYFIFIGRFSHEKHPEMIIEAFEKLNDPKIGVVLLGNGVMYDELKSRETENIILPGFKTNVYDYLIACDYYISASDIEGLPNTLLESMTVGLPCVLSDIGAHREVIAKTTQPMGYTFDNTSMDSLLTAIKKTMALDVLTTAMSIREVFEKYYTAKHMSEQYQEEYEKIMNSSHHRWLQL